MACSAARPILPYPKIATRIIVVIIKFCAKVLLFFHIRKFYTKNLAQFEKK